MERHSVKLALALALLAVIGIALRACQEGAPSPAPPAFSPSRDTEGDKRGRLLLPAQQRRARDGMDASRAESGPSAAWVLDLIVRDERSKALPKVQVQLYTKTNDGSLQPASRSGSTDSEGRAAVALESEGEPAVLILTASGYLNATVDLEQQQVNPGRWIRGRFHPDGCALEVGLERAHALTGRVIDSLGEPVPGAWVSARRWTDQIGSNRQACDARGEFRILDAIDGEVYEVAASPTRDGRAWARTVAQAPARVQIVMPDENRLHVELLGLPEHAEGVLRLELVARRIEAEHREAQVYDFAPLPSGVEGTLQWIDEEGTRPLGHVQLLPGDQVIACRLPEREAGPASQGVLWVDLVDPAGLPLDASEWKRRGIPLTAFHFELQLPSGEGSADQSALPASCWGRMVRKSSPPYGEIRFPVDALRAYPNAVRLVSPYRSGWISIPPEAWLEDDPPLEGSVALPLDLEDLTQGDRLLHFFGKDIDLKHLTLTSLEGKPGYQVYLSSEDPPDAYLRVQPGSYRCHAVDRRNHHCGRVLTVSQNSSSEIELEFEPKIAVAGQLTAGPSYGVVALHRPHELWPGPMGELASDGSFAVESDRPGDGSLVVTYWDAMLEAQGLMVVPVTVTEPPSFLRLQAPSQPSRFVLEVRPGPGVDGFVLVQDTTPLLQVPGRRPHRLALPRGQYEIIGYHGSRLGSVRVTESFQVGSEQEPAVLDLRL